MIPRVRSVSAGLGSRDVGPGDLLAVFDWLADPRPPSSGSPRSGSAIRWPSRAGRSTCAPPGPSACAGTRSAGSDPSRRQARRDARRRPVRPVVQAYPRYGSEKKGLPTTYYLTLATERIRQHGELEHVDFVPLHDVAAFRQGDPLRGLADGGTVFVQSPLTDPSAIWASIPFEARQSMLDRRIRLAALDTAGLARSTPPAGPGPAAAGHRPRRRVPSPDAVRRSGRARPRRAADGGAAGPPAVLRQARQPRRGRQPRPDRRRLRRGHRRDRSPHRPGRGTTPRAGDDRSLDMNASHRRRPIPRLAT